MALKEIRMLLLPCFSCLSNCLVQGFDVCLEGGDFFCAHIHRICKLLDLGHNLRQFCRRFCFPLSTLFQCHLAPSLRFIISGLIFAQQHHHFIDHFDHAFQPLGLALGRHLQFGVQSEQENLELSIVGPVCCSSQRGLGFLSNGCTFVGCLQETKLVLVESCSPSSLENVQGIVVIKYSYRF